jgi:hypothetical protein
MKIVRGLGLILVGMLLISGSTFADKGKKNHPMQPSASISTDDAPDDPASNYKASRSFHQVVRDNFKSWSQGPGQLEKNHLAELLGDISIRGDDAAALVVLVKAMYDNKNPIAATLTKKELNALERGDQKLDKQFHDVAGRIARIKRTLFASGKPHFEALKQGPAGNCYFFAPLGWMVKFRPNDVVSAIRPANGGGYSVRFPSGDEVQVSEPTDAEIGGFHSISTIDDGFWVVVLEKALGELQAERNSRKAEIPNPILRVVKGGSGMGLIKKWSGKDIDVVPLGSDANLADIRDSLKSLSNGERLTLTGTPKDPGGHLAGGHVYAVFGYKPKADKVVIWNPWGNDFQPKGREGLINGYVTRHGQFEMPLKEFVATFSNLRIGQ